VCPHADGPLADAQIDGEVLVCPLHQHVFELASGRSRTGQPPARVFGAEVDDGGQVVITALD
jgi:nitrite reductase/ring-hydroxylating ferredoxin subunit